MDLRIMFFQLKEAQRPCVCMNSFYHWKWIWRISIEQPQAMKSHLNSSWLITLDHLQIDVIAWTFVHAFISNISFMYIGQLSQQSKVASAANEDREKERKISHQIGELKLCWLHNGFSDLNDLFRWTEERRKRNDANEKPNLVHTSAKSSRSIPI